MTTQEPEPRPRARKPRKKLKDMTPEELAGRKARQAERDKAWLREHHPHMAMLIGVFCVAIAGVTGAGSYEYDNTVQTQWAGVLLIFSAIPVMLFGVDAAVFLFLGLGLVAFVAAGVLWLGLRLEKRGK